MTLCGCGATNPRTEIPNSPPTAAASGNPTDQHSPGGLGVAEIRATPVTPGQCSDTYLIEGEVLQLPQTRHHLWVVRRLEADPANGSPNAQHYPKAEIDLRAGRFSLTVSNSTPTGQKRGAYLLVVAEDSAHAELRRSYEADEANDTVTYPDGLRVNLPSGSDPITRTPIIEESCP